jgi:glycosyltransferase involved in cell wall biosynthesis
VTCDELKEIARGAGVGDRVLLLGRVPQRDVPGLYAGASAIAYPSLYETFGHPVLEAFAAGTPLLTSSRGATAEVAGSGARLVDPEDVDDIAAGLADVLLDDGLRQRLIEAGRQRVREFSWEKCARETIDVFERAWERRREYGRPGPATAPSAGL